MQTILDALAARGLEYEVVASVESLDVELPGLADDGVTLQDVRITDRDVLLARAGAGPRRIPPLERAGRPVRGRGPPAGRDGTPQRVGLRGRHRGRTHRARGLDAPRRGRGGIERAQAAELLAGPLASAPDAILMGDLNSDALGNPGPDATATYADLLEAGLSDAWAVAHPTEPGATWGRPGGLVDPDPTLVERIDYVLCWGALDILDAVRVGEDPADRLGGLWPSDHAGVSATFTVESPSPRSR